MKYSAVAQVQLSSCTILYRSPELCKHMFMLESHMMVADPEAQALKTPQLRPFCKKTPLAIQTKKVLEGPESFHFNLDYTLQSTAGSRLSFNKNILPTLYTKGHVWYDYNYTKCPKQANPQVQKVRVAAAWCRGGSWERLLTGMSFLFGGMTIPWHQRGTTGVQLPGHTNTLSYTL